MAGGRARRRPDTGDSARRRGPRPSGALRSIPPTPNPAGTTPGGRQLQDSGRALKTLRENHASCINYLASVKDKDRLAEALDKEWPGPIPFTLLIAPGGKVIYRKSGAIDPLEVRRKIADTIGRTYASRPE